MGDFFSRVLEFKDLLGVFGLGDDDFIGWVECNGDIDLFFVYLGVVTRIVITFYLFSIQNYCCL